MSLGLTQQTERSVRCLHKELNNHTGYDGNNHYVTQLLFSQNSLLCIAWGSDYFLMEMYSKIFSCTNMHAGD